LRVSLIILSKRFGGAEQHTLDLANHLATEGLAIQLIARRNSWLAPLQSTDLNPLIRVDFLPPLFKRWHLKQALKAFQPDILHSHLGKASRLVAGLKLGMPCVATLHGQYKHKDHARLQGLICVSPWQRKTIPHSFSGEVRDIPNFLNPTPLRGNERQEIRQIHGIENATFVIGSVGRFSHEKGINILIQAFKLAGLPNSRLLLVGDGPERTNLETQADSTIIFAGWQNNPASYYAAFDLFVLPSRAESFGLTLLCAMQAGLPIVSTATEGPTWLLGKEAGVLVDVDDATAMAQSISRLAHDHTLRTRLGAHARDRAKQFRPKHVIPEIIRLYQTLLARTETPPLS
jgi:glycosyltransferase involved in cell wall biosynthesis